MVQRRGYFIRLGLAYLYLFVWTRIGIGGSCFNSRRAFLVSVGILCACYGVSLYCSMNACAISFHRGLYYID